MSALGQFGSAIGQGYGQGFQQRQEQQRLYNQQALQERQVATQEEELAQRDRWKRDEMDWMQIKDLSDRLNDPAFRRSAKPGVIKKLETDLAYRKSRRPEWFAPEAGESAIGIPGDSAARQQTPEVAVQPPAPEPGSASLAEGMQPAFMQRGAAIRAAETPQPPAPNPNDITDQQVSSLMRETDPNFNIAQNQRQAAMQPPPVQPKGPVRQEPTEAQMPAWKVAALATEQAANRYWAMSKDPNESEEDRDRFAQMAANLSERALSQRQGQQALREGNIRLQYLEPGLQLGQAGQIEDILMKRFERKVGRPTELGIQQAQLEAKKIAAAIDAADKAADREKAIRELNLKLAQYNLDVSQFDAMLIQRAKENGYKDADLALKLRDPDWRTKLYAETAAKHAYVTNPISGQETPGPTHGEFNRIIGAGGQPSGRMDFNSFDHAGYLRDPASSPQQKAAFYKQQGWPVPKSLLGRKTTAKK